MPPVPMDMRALLTGSEGLKNLAKRGWGSGLCEPVMATAKRAFYVWHRTMPPFTSTELGNKKSRNTLYFSEELNNLKDDIVPASAPPKQSHTNSCSLCRGVVTRGVVDS